MRCGADYCVQGKVHLYNKQTQSVQKLPCPTCAVLNADARQITMIDVPVGEYL